MDGQAGITRDRHYAHTSWDGVGFTMVDTGGFLPRSETGIEVEVKNQIQIALEEADALLFLVDAKDGVTPIDEDISRLLKKSPKPILLVANKVDGSPEREWGMGEFYRLGLGDPAPISALNGWRVGEMLDLIVDSLPKKVSPKEEEDALRLAVVGRPNVGKSSLINAFLGEPRLIVTPTPGTTRDAIDSYIGYFKQKILLIDTAGIRRKQKITGGVEFYSTVRALRALDRCHVAVIMIDGTEGLTHQDVLILEEALQRRKGVVLAVNKWDLVPKDVHTLSAYERAIKGKLGRLDFVPVLFVSALTKKRLFKILEMAQNIFGECQKRIETAKLNDAMGPIIEQSPPPAVRGKFIKIKYVTQVSTLPPRFVFFCNEPRLVKDHYRRFLENQIRGLYGFEGVPINIVFRKK